MTLKDSSTFEKRSHNWAVCRMIKSEKTYLISVFLYYEVRFLLGY